MTEDAGSGATERAPRAWLDLRRTRIAGVLAVVLVIACVLWLVLRDGGSHSGSPVPKGARAVLISIKGLKTLARLGIPIYWAGEQPGVTYELTKTADNRVYIRYLPSPGDVGTKKPYLTIGTYPMKAAYAITRRLARLSTSRRVDVGGNAVGFYNRANQTSVFLAHRELDYQIQVYDPRPNRALELVKSREVDRVR